MQQAYLDREIFTNRKFKVAFTDTPTEGSVGWVKLRGRKVKLQFAQNPVNIISPTGNQREITGWMPSRSYRRSESFCSCFVDCTTLSLA